MQHLPRRPRAEIKTRLKELEPVIKEEYSRRTLKELVYYLSKEHRLGVSESSLQKFLHKSGIRKNERGEVWVWVHRVAQERELQGNDSKFFRRDEIISEKKRKKEIARHVPSVIQATSKNAPIPSTPSGWIVRSPMVEVADADASTASTQTPGRVDFQRARSPECDPSNVDIASDCLKSSITESGLYSDIDRQAYHHVDELGLHQSEVQIEAQPRDQVPMSLEEIFTSIRNSTDNDRDSNPVENETSLDENFQVILEASHTHNDLTSAFDIQLPTETVEQLIRHCRMIFAYNNIVRANFSLRYVRVVYAANLPPPMAGVVSGFRKKFRPDVFEHALNILALCCSYKTTNGQPGHQSCDNTALRVGREVLWPIQDAHLRRSVFGVALTLAACQSDPKPVETLKFHAQKHISASAVRHVLFICSSQGNTTLLDLFWRMRFDLDTKFNDGATALYSAAVYNQVEAVRFLLERRVEVNPATSDGRTAFATICNLPTHSEVRELLIKYGADVDMTGKDESPAASQATPRGIDSRGTGFTSGLQSDSPAGDKSVLESRQGATRDLSGEPRTHWKNPASNTASKSQLHNPLAASLWAHQEAEPDRSVPLWAAKPPRVFSRRDDNPNREINIADSVMEPKHKLTVEALKLSVKELSLADKDNSSVTSSLVSMVLPPISSSLGKAIQAQSASSWPLSEVKALFSGSTCMISEISSVRDNTPRPQIRRMNSPKIPEMSF